MEVIRHDEVFLVQTNPLVNLVVINLKMIDQDNIIDLMDAINEMSADNTRIMKFVMLYPSNQYREYEAGEEFITDFTDELEKMDLERYMLMMNPFPKKEEEPVV